MVLGFALLAAEALTPGFFLLFFGIGAVFMGFFQLLIPGVDLWIELLIFLSVSSLWLALFRRRLIQYMEKRNPPKRVDSIEGETAAATELVVFSEPRTAVGAIRVQRRVLEGGNTNVVLDGKAVKRFSVARGNATALLSFTVVRPSRGQTLPEG